MVTRVLMAAVVVAVLGTASAQAQAPVAYEISFPAPEHHLVQVEATFADLPAGRPLAIRMSRTSPGRYALHEFAKNVFDVHVTDGTGTPLTPARPNLHQWDVSGHDGTVRVTYTVYGDRTDGTYLSIDPSHAHMNMPAVLMWARGLESRSATIAFDMPAGADWKVATQLLPTSDPTRFTAPNLQYLMDSPAELSAFTMRTFTVEGPSGKPATYRIALHHDGTDAEVDAYARDVEKIVREEIRLFGAVPDYEPGYYTFLADYLPWANGDGMEHRNSTIITSSGALRNPAQRRGILGTVAHEFIHSWNMERIRSAAVEPFDFENADVSEELWLGEGVTNYLDNLVMYRAGLQSIDDTLADQARTVNAVTLSPGRRIRSAREMSRLAPFVDAAVTVDRTTWPNTFISYYTWGSAIGLNLDLSLRELTKGRRTIEDFMRQLWKVYGAPGQQEPGLVATPYTLDGVQEQLATVSGDAAFAADFITRFVKGREVPDYAHLLGLAGFLVRPAAPDKASVQGGTLRFTGGGAAEVGGLVRTGSALYEAGIDQDDRIVALDGTALTSEEALAAVLARHEPGDEVAVRFVRRTGQEVDGTLRLDADPRIEIVPVEKAGGTLTPDQERFRKAWMG